MLHSNFCDEKFYYRIMIFLKKEIHQKMRRNHGYNISKIQAGISCFDITFVLSNAISPQWLNAYFFILYFSLTKCSIIWEIPRLKQAKNGGENRKIWLKLKKSMLEYDLRSCKNVVLVIFLQIYQNELIFWFS